MSRRAPLIAAAAGAGLLLAKAGRRLRARRSPDVPPLPEGVQEYPSTFVDKRHVSDAGHGAPTAHGTTGTQVAAEFYEEKPPPEK